MIDKDTSNCSGIAIITFKIDSTGNIEYAKVSKGLRYDIDSMLVEVVCKLKKRIPATINGRNVYMYKRQPFVFCSDSNALKSTDRGLVCPQ